MQRYSPVKAEPVLDRSQPSLSRVLFAFISVRLISEEVFGDLIGLRTANKKTYLEIILYYVLLS